MKAELETQLNFIQASIEELNEKPFNTVAQNFVKAVSDNIVQSPYRFLLTAFGVGLGVSGLDNVYLKKAAIHVGKLVAYRVLAEMDQKGELYGK